MKSRLESFARIAETAAAIAVVISVIYLALQITANTKLLRSQAHFNALSLGQRPMEFMIESDTLGGIVAQCDADPDRAPPVAWSRCLNYYFLEINAWEYIYYQHLDGSIPQEYWVGADAYFKSQMEKKPAYRRAWHEFQYSFDEPFRSFANAEYERTAAAAASLPAAVPEALRMFAVRYSAAWCSGDPARVAAFFAEDATLTINGGAPHAGRTGIAEAARSFMTAYPDMIVELERLERQGDGYRFRWRFTGTNSGPGGTGRVVRISGYEDWTLDAGGLVAKSLGHYDAADWDRQLGKG